MMKPQKQARTATCECGQVKLEAEGAPIIAAKCYCESCQAAGQHFETLSGAPPVLEEDGGTDFVLFRKDRVRCVSGGAALSEHRLSPSTKTRRVLATCCNSAMFLDFTNGHWLSLYKARIPLAHQPPLEVRTMTKDRRAGVEFTDDVPSPGTHSGRFMWKLLTAWVAMGFRVPKVDYVKGEI